MHTNDINLFYGGKIFSMRYEPGIIEWYKENHENLMNVLFLKQIKKFQVNPGAKFKKLKMLKWTKSWIMAL